MRFGHQHKNWCRRLLSDALPSRRVYHWNHRRRVLCAVIGFNLPPPYLRMRMSIYASPLCMLCINTEVCVEGGVLHSSCVPNAGPCFVEGEFQEALAALGCEAARVCAPCYLPATEGECTVCCKTNCSLISPFARKGCHGLRTVPCAAERHFSNTCESF